MAAGAACFARDQGARVLEAYPLSPAPARVPLAAAWPGFESSFLRAGFTEVARRVPLRPVLRQALAPHDEGGEAQRISKRAAALAERSMGIAKEDL